MPRWHAGDTSCTSWASLVVSAVCATRHRTNARPRRTRGCRREPWSAPTGRKHMDTAATKVRATPAAMRYRIMQLVVGLVCMVAIANLQYGWTLFVDPINQQYQWG